MASKVQVRAEELSAAIQKMPGSLVEALIPAVTEMSSRHPCKAQTIFLARAIPALVSMSGEVTATEIASAPSDYDLLLALLQKPEVQKLLPSRDPLAAAKIRGLKAQQQLLGLEGGCISSEKVAELLGIKRQAVDKRRKHGKLIGLYIGRTYQYPLWQFENSRTIPGLERTLMQLSLNVQDPWMQAAWMLNGNDRLTGQSPINLLRAGQEKAVLEAASLFGEQTAS
jgi:biotin operon repressor